MRNGQEQRILIVVGEPSDNTFLGKAPATADWQYLRTLSFDAADHVLATHRDIRVGLFIQSAEASRDDLRAAAILRQKHPRLQWLMLLSTRTSANPAVTAFVAQQCFDYLTAPVEHERILASAGRAFGMSQMVEQSLIQTGATDQEDQMIGASPRMRALFRELRKVAASDAPVFIGGETGTGKELAARAIHERSRRSDGPFVTVDCGAIPGTLIQSELFGYEQGAFTGAQKRKIGRIEAAQGGTLFLDEIGDLRFDLQTNLLRFLEEGTILRIGATRDVGLDVRVLAASHVDLQQAVKEGSFREDLFYRLTVLKLTMPPLRERADDVEIMAKFFVYKFAREARKPILGLTVAAQEALKEHTWPGNVRELINRIQRAVVMCDGKWIGPVDLDFQGETPLPPHGVPVRGVLETALGECHNNYSAAARMLGISRQTLYQLLRKADT
jgi:DNA-binding NtrC family response regulator